MDGNELFTFQHHYIVHTLEDGMLFEILKAMHENRKICFQNFSEKVERLTTHEGIPLKIFISAATGRRYVCLYMVKRGRFSCFRLDYIKSVQLLEVYSEAKDMKKKLDNNLDQIWGVSFGGRNRCDQLIMKLWIDERKETYVIDRINREGRGGSLERIGPNTFLYTKKCFDATEMTPWIKTFTGRILKLESNNQEVIDRFNQDMTSLYQMYWGSE